MLILFFALSLSQIVSTSPTFDEGFYILRGYAFFRTGYLIPLGHPPFAQTLSALGVMLEPNLPDPQSLDGWATDKYDDASRDLLWQRGLNATRIVFLARFPILLIGLLVGAITFKWAKELFGWRSGVAALALHALSPNLLAHAALATTDLPVAAFYFCGLLISSLSPSPNTSANSLTSTNSPAKGITLFYLEKFQQEDGGITISSSSSSKRRCQF
ncbi:MAG: hypothetical protein HZB17_00470 [Chloroflexi bacterium]|nr:hypothetical protein [Chloroflexota bacterium]